MSGIPTYTSAPLNSNQKEQSTTAIKQDLEPATAIESSTTAPQPPNTSATATAPSYAPIYATSQNPPAAPGAAASLPAPTAAPVPPTAGNATATPTSTFPSTTSQSPPAPQPGAIPTPPVAGFTPTAPSPVPPPPKAGEAVPQAMQSTAPPTGAPTQAPYTQSYAYQRPSVSHTAVPNSTSSPYSSVYRTSSDAGSSRPQGLPTHYNSSGGGGASDIFPDEEPGFVSSAKGWMQFAGTKLAAVEAEVWKRINDVHEK